MWTALSSARTQTSSSPFRPDRARSPATNERTTGPPRTSLAARVHDIVEQHCPCVSEGEPFECPRVSQSRVSVARAGIVGWLRGGAARPPPPARPPAAPSCCTSLAGAGRRACLRSIQRLECCSRLGIDVAGRDGSASVQFASGCPPTWGWPRFSISIYVGPTPHCVSHPFRTKSRSSRTRSAANMRELVRRAPAARAAPSARPPRTAVTAPPPPLPSPQNFREGPTAPSSPPRPVLASGNGTVPY